MINWSNLQHMDLDGFVEVGGKAQSGRIYQVAGGEGDWAAFTIRYTPEDGWQGPDAQIAEAGSREEAEEACERHEARLCVEEARDFVAAAEAHRRSSTPGETAAREASRLLEAAARIDVTIEGVGDAIRAAAFLHGAGRVTSAVAYLEEFCKETQAQLETHQAAKTVRQPEIVFREPRM